MFQCPQKISPEEDPSKETDPIKIPKNVGSTLWPCSAIKILLYVLKVESGPTCVEALLGVCLQKCKA